MSLTGCTANTVKSVNNLASLSQDYTTNLSQYLEETEETIINTENYSVMINHWDKKDRTNRLKESESNLQIAFTMIDDLTRNATLLNDYFSKLNALLDDESNKKLAESLQSISTSLSGVEGVDEFAQKAGEIYSAYKVKEIIKRDHTKIAKFLEINNDDLNQLNELLKISLDENQELKKDRIEKDYSNKGKPLDSEWTKDRAEYLKIERSYSEITNNSVLTTGSDLAKAWDKVGKNSLEVGDLQELVKELQKFNKLISELKMINAANN